MALVFFTDKRGWGITNIAEGNGGEKKCLSKFLRMSFCTAFGWRHFLNRFSRTLPFVVMAWDPEGEHGAVEYTSCSCNETGYGHPPMRAYL